MVSVLTGVTRFHKWATSYLPIDCIYMSELENINLHTDSVKCLGSRKLSWFVSLFMTGKQTAFMGSLASKEMNIAIHTQWWNEQEIHYGEKWFSGFSFHDLSFHPLLVFFSSCDNLCLGDLSWRFGAVCACTRTRCRSPVDFSSGFALPIGTYKFKCF